MRRCIDSGALDLVPSHESPTAFTHEALNMLHVTLPLSDPNPTPLSPCSRARSVSEKQQQLARVRNRPYFLVEESVVYQLVRKKPLRSGQTSSTIESKSSQGRHCPILPPLPPLATYKDSEAKGNQPDRTSTTQHRTAAPLPAVAPAPEK